MQQTGNIYLSFLQVDYAKFVIYSRLLCHGVTAKFIDTEITFAICISLTEPCRE
jgi:hypothetical protein